MSLLRNQWSKEYLQELREHAKINVAKGNRKEIEVGDVVVVFEEMINRVKWRLGKIEKVIVGRDEVARGALVRV